MTKKLIPTLVRIPEELKGAAEEAAAADDRSFSNYVCQAIAEKLARDTVTPPTLEKMHSFTVITEFDFPRRMSAHSLAQVTTAAMNNTARDVGARNVRSRLCVAVPPTT